MIKMSLLSWFIHSFNKHLFSTNHLELGTELDLGIIIRNKIAFVPTKFAV